jgi:hypothetical protein
MCCTKGYSAVNSIYSGQVFSYSKGALNEKSCLKTPITIAITHPRQSNDPKKFLNTFVNTNPRHLLYFIATIKGLAREPLLKEKAQYR